MFANVIVGGLHVGEDDAQQRDKYQRLLATMRYHKRHGKVRYLCISRCKS